MKKRFYVPTKAQDIEFGQQFTCGEEGPYRRLEPTFKLNVHGRQSEHVFAVDGGNTLYAFGPNTSVETLPTPEEQGYHTASRDDLILPETSEKAVDSLVFAFMFHADGLPVLATERRDGKFVLETMLQVFLAVVYCTLDGEIPVALKSEIDELQRPPAAGY